MAKTPEGQFQEQVIKYLKSLDKCWYCKVWGGGYQKSGIPDILACINDKFVAIELKAPKGVATELQKRNIRLINECGGYGVILYPKDFDKFKMEVEGFNGANCCQI